MPPWKPWTSYRRLETGDSGIDTAETEVNSSKDETSDVLQPLNADQKYVHHTIQPTRRSSICGWPVAWTGVVVLMTVVSFLFLSTIATSTILAETPRLDVLRYIDPLIGTGRGGMFGDDQQESVRLN